MPNRDEMAQTVREIFQALTVHNAYHLGKIVALRQRLGAWTVEERRDQQEE